MIVDRKQEHSLTQEDLDLMLTFAHQVAIALDNASAYQQIEELNVGLEAKVRERTKELEQADRLRSQFLSHVSHELKTPMTSIKGFLQNMSPSMRRDFHPGSALNKDASSEGENPSRPIPVSTLIWIGNG